MKLINCMLMGTTLALAVSGCAYHAKSKPQPQLRHQLKDIAQPLVVLERPPSTDKVPNHLRPPSD